MGEGSEAVVILNVRFEHKYRGTEPVEQQREHAEILQSATDHARLAGSPTLSNVEAKRRLRMQKALGRHEVPDELLAFRRPAADAQVFFPCWRWIAGERGRRARTLGARIPGMGHCIRAPGLGTESLAICGSGELPPSRDVW